MACNCPFNIQHPFSVSNRVLHCSYSGICEFKTEPDRRGIAYCNAFHTIVKPEVDSTIDELTSLWKNLGKRSNIVKLIETRGTGHYTNKLYELDNNKRIGVHSDFLGIVSIVEQRTKSKEFAMLTNGQASTNGVQVYFRY
jgi:hypothetical protein